MIIYRISVHARLPQVPIQSKKLKERTNRRVELSPMKKGIKFRKVKRNEAGQWYYW